MIEDIDASAIKPPLPENSRRMSLRKDKVCRSRRLETASGSGHCLTGNLNVSVSNSLGLAAESLELPA